MTLLPVLAQDTLVRLAGAALPVVIDAWVKGAVVLAAAWVATRLMGRASAATRHLVWTVGFCGLLALPVASLVVPAWRVPVPASLRPLVAPPAAAWESARSTASAGASASASASISPDTVFAAAVASVEPRPAATTRPRSSDTAWSTRSLGDPRAKLPISAYWVGAPPEAALTPAPAVTRGTWVVGYWLAGALFILGGLLRGRWQVSRMGQRAQRVRGAAWIELAQGVADRLGLRRPVTLLRSAGAGVPVTWGAVYPVVLLPADADAWTAERKNAVLVHEMAHVTRFDVVTQLIAQLATALHWPNPLAWVALRQLRAERERACDDQVLAAGATASAYAGDLLEIVRSLGSADRPALAALAMAHRSEFEGRLLAILDPSRSRSRVSQAAGLTTVAAAIALIVPLAAMRPAASAAGGESRAPRPARPAGALLVDTVADTLAYATGYSYLDTMMVAGPGPDGAPPASTWAPLAAPAPLPAFATFPATAAAAPTAPTSATAATPAAAGMSCDLERTGGRLGAWRSRGRQITGTHISINESDGRCFVVDVVGRIEFTDDERDVASVSSGGYLTIVEQLPDVARRMEFEPDERGGVRRTYWLDGDEQPLDDDGRRWLTSVLPVVVRETAEPGPRAKRILARGGPDAVIAEARRIASDDSKGGYFAALFDAAAGDRRLMERLTSEIGRSIASDETKRRLLSDLARRSARDPAAVADVVQASETIASDDERRRLLSGLVTDGAGRETLIRAARSAARIASDDEKAGLLLEIADRYVTDDSLRRELLRTARTIASDDEKGRVLLALLSRGSLSPRARVELLEVAGTIASDDEKRSVLEQFATAETFGDENVRRAFFVTARSIASDDDKQQLLSGILERRPPAAVVADCLRAARGIASDESKATVLLAAAAGPLDASMRELLMDVAETLSSDSDYRRVTAAVVRSPKSADR